jgi:hypothetical protein
VTDKAWKAIGCKPDDILCEPCMHERFENRLGRPLLFGELVRCPFNFGWARPLAKDHEPITFWDPYVERWLAQEHKKFRANRTEESPKPTKH